MTIRRRELIVSAGVSLVRAALRGAGGVGLGGAVSGAVGACAPGPPPGPPLLAGIGVQLYTVRQAMSRSPERTLERVREIGYEEVEFAGWFGRSAAAVRRMLDETGLRAPAAHVGLDELESDAAALFDRANRIGHRWLVVPWVDAERRRTIGDWHRVAELLQRSGESARAAGLRLAYHNHDFEFPAIDRTVPFELLLRETSADALDFEVDLYWLARAGADPFALLGAHPGRFALAHLKDSAGAPEHRMVDVGAGVLDWPRLIAAGRQAGIRHWFVEHDEPDDEFRSIRHSYRFLAGGA